MASPAQGKFTNGSGSTRRVRFHAEFRKVADNAIGVTRTNLTEVALDLTTSRSRSVALM